MLSDTLNEMQRLNKTLDLWAKVKSQGISPDSVESFIFDPTLENALKVVTKHWQRNKEGYIVIEQFNAVKLKDGSKKILSPILDRIF